jgi:hypothetical protein
VTQTALDMDNVQAMEDGSSAEGLARQDWIGLPLLWCAASEGEVKLTFQDRPVNLRHVRAD